MTSVLKNKETLNNCPQIPISIGNERVLAVIDTVSKISPVKEKMYHKSRSEDMESLELGLQNAVLVSAIGNKTKRIRLQAMKQNHIDDIVLDHIFLMSHQLITQAPFGVEFCRMNSVIINFPEQCFTMERDGKIYRHHFAYANNVRTIRTGDLGPTTEQTDTDSMQVAADPITNRATADYPTQSLRTEASNEVDVLRRSEQG